MKAKIKFDTAVIKNFFTDHIEKIVAGICVIFMLFLITTIFKRETLPSNLQAPQIASETSNVRTTVETAPYQETGDLKPIEVPGAVAELPVNQLDEVPAFVRAGAPLSDPVKRSDPTYFPVLAPQVTSFVFAMSTNAASGTAATSVAPVAPAINRRPGASRAPVLDTKPGGATAPGAATRKGRVAHPGTETTPSTSSGLPGSRSAPADVATDPLNTTSIPSAMPLPGPLGTGAAEVRPFNIITAAIPVEMQQKEYDRKFSHARHADMEADPRSRVAQQQMTDLPQYIWWRLERIDLTHGSEKTVLDYGDVASIVTDRKSETIGADLVMKTLKPTGRFVKLNADVAQWGGVGAEVVPSAYHADTWLTWPLPPMLLHDWGREATHSKIPLVEPKANETPDGANPAEPGAEPGKSKSKDNDNPFDDKSLSADATPSPRAMSPAQPSFMNGTGIGRTSRDFSRRNPRGMGFNQGNPRNFIPGAQQSQYPDAPQVPYKLFRFTDFDVEPGHTYQYRIQLVLRNPNFGQPPELLAKPQPKPLPYADTPWSELSAPSTVPVLNKVIVESVERPKKGEPKAKAGVLGWIKKDPVSGTETEANQLLAKSELNLGDVANFIQKKIQAVIDPVKWNVHDFTVDLISNAALVDMHGGGDDKTSPDGGGQGELLVLIVGRNGEPDRLAVVNQAMDKLALDAWTKTHIVPKEIADAEAENNVPVRGALGTSSPGGLLSRPTPNSSRSTAPPRPQGVGR
jgi:hypothetical protein